MMRNGLPAMAPVPLDLDFEKTEMKYDSTGMFHWTPSRPIEDCILVSLQLWPGVFSDSQQLMVSPACRIVTRRP